jgi:hypothetical protein
MVGVMAEATAIAADILRRVVRVARVTLPTDRFQRILD